MRAAAAPSVVVAIPAHDEESGIADCVGAVARSLLRARRRGAVESAFVSVVAHNCSDQTAALAARELARLLGADCGVGVGWRVVTLNEACDVGAVRRHAVELGLAQLGRLPNETWVLSTDADTRVGDGWVGDVLAEAAADGAACVAGLALIDWWRGSEDAASRYAQIVASKLYVDDLGRRAHRHVYGANLAVRADAYADVGGFPAHGHGEDQRLVDALIAHGHRVLATADITVLTSGRLAGRAPDGLADLLYGLDVDSADVAS